MGIIFLSFDVLEVRSFLFLLQLFFSIFLILITALFLYVLSKLLDKILLRFISVVLTFPRIACSV